MKGLLTTHDFSAIQLGNDVVCFSYQWRSYHFSFDLLL